MDALDELLADLEALLDAQTTAPAPSRADEGNFRCVRCEGCSDCRFCVECRDCEECTYCETCIACRSCTQCRGCRDCERTSHSALSRACDGCSYVVLSVGCEECVHCFGCVGLAKAEFCVLNEQYSRRDYQAKVTELRAILDARLSKGWTPAFLIDEGEREAVDESATSAEPEPPPREPDAPTGGNRIEEAAAPRASSSDEGRAITAGRAPRPNETRAVAAESTGPSVTRAGRPAAARPSATPTTPAQAPASVPASVLTGRRPPRS
ncbi:MAG TPA: hypothetical protein VFG69_21680 [Nannocystaceae bacterium]|nr:hypothetical protein [Nannocystaceae bacterium]